MQGLVGHCKDFAFHSELAGGSLGLWNGGGTESDLGFPGPLWLPVENGRVEGLGGGRGRRLPHGSPGRTVWHLGPGVFCGCLEVT